MKISNRIFILSFIILVLTVSITQVYSQQEDDIIVTLENIDGNLIDFTKSELIELLCNSKWTYGYLYVNFLDDGIYESGVQESYEGKWKIDHKGDIHVDPWLEGEAENFLQLRTTYCLTNEYDSDAFYSQEYYDKYNASEESKMIAEIELSNISEEDIISIWVTDDQGPMGELLGFEFTPTEFRFSRPGLELPFGCWDDVVSEDKGTWSFDKKEHVIEINWVSENFTKTIRIKLTSFYNGAFKGTISPEFFFDEVGLEERTFWKSECD